MIYKKQENKDLYYTSSYIQAFYKKDTSWLQIISDKAMIDYQSSQNEKYLHYYAISKILIDTINQTSIYTAEKEIINKYLIRCENWGYYELTLFTNTISFYSNDLIDIVYKKAKARILHYRHLSRYRNEFSVIIFNILEKKIRSKEYSSLKKYLNELDNLKSNNKDVMYFQTMYSYFENIINIIYDVDIPESLEKINYIIQVFKYLNMSLKEEQCKNLLNEVIKNKDI